MTGVIVHVCLMARLLTLGCALCVDASSINVLVHGFTYYLRENLCTTTFILCYSFVCGVVTVFVGVLKILVL